MVRPSPEKRNNSSVFLIASIVLSISWSLILLWPHLFDPFRVPIDVQNHYWMAKFQDPTLFPDDPLVYDQLLQNIKIGDFSILIYPRSLGYGLLFWAGSFFISHTWLSKLLLFLLLPVTIGYLYRYGVSLDNQRLGFTLAVVFGLFNLASPDSLSLASGLQRAFALPLFIGFVYYLSDRNYWGASLTTIVAALFYLPNVPVMGLTFLCALIWEEGDEKRVNRKISVNFAPFLAAMIISGTLAAWAVLSSGVISDATAPANLFNDVSILEDPRHQLGGAAPFFLHVPWIGRAGIFETYPEAVILLVMIFLSGIVAYLLPDKEIKKIPKQLWYLLISGMLMYALSLISLLALSSKILYMPSRYVRGALFLIPVFFLSIHADTISSNLRKCLCESPFKEKATFIFGALCAIFIITGVVFGFSFPDCLGWFLMILGGVLLSGALMLWFFTLSHKISRWDWKEEPLREQMGFGLLGLSLLAGFFFYSRLVGYGTINPTPHERDLYTYVETLPKNALLAGSPEELTAMPLFAKRSVLFHALRPNESAPIIKTFDAYYGEEGQEIVAFCEEYDVDYLVYNKGDFAPEYIAEGDYFYVPYNQPIKDTVSRRDQFVLPKAKPVFKSGPLGVVPCRLSSFDQREGG